MSTKTREQFKAELTEQVERIITIGAAELQDTDAVALRELLQQNKGVMRELVAEDAGLQQKVQRAMGILLASIVLNQTGSRPSASLN